MENKTQNYTPEILKIIRSNTSPGIMRNKLEDYHENDLAEVFPELTVKERVKLCRILDLDMLSDIFEHTDEKEAAEYLGISYWLVNQLVRRKQIPCARVGGRVLFRIKALDEYLSAKEEKSLNK